ncbi:MAG TPA: FAD:protein FMN transferase [Polyangia bacterium]|nr:FAD:protein FMN transferase [Polyangia bacterium]
MLSALHLGLLASMFAAASPRVHHRAYQVMGTEAVFTAWTADIDKADQAFAAAYAEIRRIEDLMTDWERPGQPVSDVVRINAAAGKPTPVPVSEETLQVIQASLDMSRRSDGAFDITYAAMRGLWKFDEDLDKRIPPAAEIERRRQLIDYRDVIVDAKKRTVRLKRAGMRLGLGGIAKGYAVDRCAEVLRRFGLRDFMVQAGGDLFVAGQKGNAHWMVGVRDPRAPKGIIAKMAIQDHAFSTAGDYERAFVLDGRRYHHIIDPKTGYPATASRGVTIFAPTAFLADALDDAVFILGPERGMALVDSYPDCSAMIVDAANKVWVSKSLEGRLERTGTPTEGP